MSNWIDPYLGLWAVVISSALLGAGCWVPSSCSLRKQKEPSSCIVFSIGALASDVSFLYCQLR